MGDKFKVTNSGDVFFRTTGGTASSFDYYEETSLTTDWTGPWATDKSAKIIINRTGEFVHLCIPFIGSDATSASVITSVTALSTRFRPGLNRTYVGRVQDNGINIFGSIFVETNGIIKITAGPVGNDTFTAANQAGMYRTEIGYCLGT